MSAVPVVSLGCRLEMYLEREVVICWLLIPRETAGKCSWIAALTLLILMNAKTALMVALRFVATHLAHLSAAVFLVLSWMRMDEHAQMLMNVSRTQTDAPRYVRTHLALLSAAVIQDMYWLKMGSPVQV
jgi:hypothetical protein